MPAAETRQLFERARQGDAGDVNAFYERCARKLLPLIPMRLGRTLPPPAQGRALYPQALIQIQNEEAYDLLEQYSALDPHAQGDVGADDWTALAQRMRYILALFRSRQQEKNMFSQPFSDMQVSALWAGKVPEGPLS